jgi:hypothetical protein
VTEPLKSLPLPDDPVLAAFGSALNEAGYFAWILDASWRVVYVTDESLLQYASLGATGVPIGAHYFSAEAVRFRREMFGGAYAARP